MAAERATRILEARLEQLAAAADRTSATGAGLLQRRVELARAATEHAVELGLLTRDEADSLWADAERRHPALARLHSLPLQS